MSLGHRDVAAPEKRRVAGRALRSRPATRRAHRLRTTAWLYLLPGFAFYGAFSLWPLIETFQYSFYKWDGITAAKWVGLKNYIKIFTSEDALSTFAHAFTFILFYAAIPVVVGLVIVGVMTRVRIRLLGLLRTVLFIPQILAMVVVAVAWRWIYAESGPINAALEAIGLDSWTRAWLGDFKTALPAVGLIGTWVMYGLCMVLFIGGSQKIPRDLYEAAKLDGAGPFQEFMAVTLPGLRGEISVALILTVTAALRNFDIVWNTTSGGPGNATLIPSYLIFEGAFVTRQVGYAAAASVVLTTLILLLTGGIQALLRQRK
ncbi:MAG: sugar ABC transporter permease [Bifidobacteriaceae bacterium]|jgi:ABC-type sugar transport system permease subunit|nr:sugar ABC transporter permease [Bifidobacteriaceae bacterium]